MAGKYFWIKERHNPQLGVYYVACGKITVKEANQMKDSLYGNNYMHKYSTEDEYEAKITELINSGQMSAIKF